MPDAREAWAFLERSDPVSSAAEVRTAIDRIAVEIQQQFRDRYPLVLVVMGLSLIHI